MTRRLVAWWDALSPEARVRWHGLALCAVVYLVAYAALSWWYVEDSAISFSFARNFVDGEGFVAYPGGERVEGFSNPTWTFLLAATYALGGGPFVAAKLLGAVFGVMTLGPVHAWARRVLPADSGRAALLAPLLLAISPQFVIWNASGLENSLFSLLLAAGSIAILREVEPDPADPEPTGRLWAWAPPSAVLYWALCITRPEAPLYVAVAGLLGLALAVRSTGLRRAVGWALRWGVTLVVPFGLFHAARFEYFGWPFPNTYYAKLADSNKFLPFGWTKSGWTYVRDYALASSQGFLLPVYALGQTGLDGWRALVGVAASVIGLVLVVPGLEWTHSLPFWPTFKEPVWLVDARIGFLVLCVVALPLVGIGRRRHGARLLAFAMTVIAVFFAIYAGGDWMEGWRWMSMAQPALVVLLADAVWTVAAAMTSAIGWGTLPQLAGGMLLAAPLLTSIGGLVAYVGGDAETSPFDVRRRVIYMQGVEKRLGLDHVTLMDVDMGAHMWWSGFDIVDMAGLVDVPMGHHKWEKPFVHQYVYEERRPEFAHVHGSWSSKTHMTTHAEWKDYLEIDPFPVSPYSTHVGNNVRKDLFVVPTWPGTSARHAVFQDGITLDGLDVPAPEVAPGQALYVEIGMSRNERPRDFRVVLFLTSTGTAERTVAADLPPGYDWYRPMSWKKDEVVLGRHSVPLPDDLPPGKYDLGLLVLGTDARGTVMPVTDATPATATGAPAFAAGEVRWPGVVTVLSTEDATALADRQVDEAVAAAQKGDCEAAEAGWSVARRHLSPDSPWQADALAKLSPEVARCHARKATPGSPDAVDEIARARRWDHRDDEVVHAGEALADVLQQQGEDAEAQGDDATAYADWRDALVADPSRSHLRVKAEAARDRSLKLHPDASADKAPADGGGE